MPTICRYRKADATTAAEITYLNEIARADRPEDWCRNSGYVANMIGDVVYISAFGHFSCYGSYGPQSLSSTWSGTVEQAIDMATRLFDPDMPERIAKQGDYDYEMLVEFYGKLRIALEAMVVTV